MQFWNKSIKSIYEFIVFKNIQMSLDWNSKRFTNAVSELELTWTKEDNDKLVAKLEQINNWRQAMLAQAVLLAQKLGDKSLSQEEIKRINDEIAKVLTTPIPWDDTWIHERNHQIIYWK